MAGQGLCVCINLLGRAVRGCKAAGPPVLVHSRALYERSALRYKAAAQIGGLHDDSIEALSTPVAVSTGLKGLAAAHR